LATVSQYDPTVGEFESSGIAEIIFLAISVAKAGQSARFRRALSHKRPHIVADGSRPLIARRLAAVYTALVERPVARTKPRSACCAT
jgi:hypothetical protein